MQAHKYTHSLTELIKKGIWLVSTKTNFWCDLDLCSFLFICSTSPLCFMVLGLLVLWNLELFSVPTRTKISLTDGMGPKSPDLSTMESVWDYFENTEETEAD